MSKISGYSAITNVQPNDLLVVVDVNDTTMAPTGTTKNMVLSNVPAYQAVTITTTGSTFNPWVQIAGTGTITWTCPGVATLTGTTPSFSFGSAANRTVYLTVADANGRDALHNVTLFNLGYAYVNDTGPYSLPATYNWPSQGVAAVSNVKAMTGLLAYAAGQIPGYTGILDCSGMAQLTNIEVFDSDLTSAFIDGCESLQRVVIETNDIGTINTNPVAPNLFEFRAAFQDTHALTFVPQVIQFGQLYHFCIRDQIVTNMPSVATMMPTVNQLWIWNTRQSGPFAPNSTQLNWLLAHSNNYTSASLANLMTSANGILDMSACLLTTADLTGCTGLNNISLCDNAFSQTEVNTICTVVDGFATHNGTLQLTGNPSPSGAGATAVTNLQNRGWTVTTGPSSISIVQTGTASGGSSITFGSNVTAGNSVLYIVGGYRTSAGAPSTSAPLLNGAGIPGSVAGFNPGGTNGITSPFDSTDGALVYVTIWLLPAIAASGQNGLTITSTGLNGISGAVAYEVAGLGATPAFGATLSNSAAHTSAVDPGQMGETGSSPQLVCGLAQVFAGLSGGPGAPWVNTEGNTPVWAGVRSATQTGGGESFNWIPTPVGAGPWAAGLVTVT